MPTDFSPTSVLTSLYLWSTIAPQLQMEGAPLSKESNSDKKSAAGNFGDMFKAFGDAISEIFRDPDLKEKARDFGRSAAESAKVLGSRFKGEDVKEKFRDVGKVAQDFGKSVADTFKEDKDKGSTDKH